MNTFKRGMLIHLREKIVQDLHVGHILNYLLMNSVINVDEREAILSEKTRKDQVRHLLDILPYKEGKAFDYFVECLKVDYFWLYNEFCNSECRTEVYENKLYDAFVVGGVPHPPPYNVHREKKLVEIRTHLKEMKRGSYVVLHGMTGAGKSCLAAAAVNNAELLMLTFKGCVLWLSVGDSSDDDILSHMVQLLQRLRLSNASAQHSTDSVITTVEMAREELKHCFLNPTLQDALLIIDGVTSPKLVDAFDIGCKIMITTKDMEVMKSVKGREKLVQIKEGLTETESLTLLAQSIQIRVEKLPSQAKDIHHLCQGSPMVLALIAGQLEDNIPDIINSAGRWKHYVRMLSAKQYSNIRRHSFTQPDGLFPTIKASVDSLPPEKKLLYLDFALFLEDVNIKPEVLQTLWGLKTKYEVEDIMTFFTKKSLAVKKWNEHFCSSVYGIHDLLLCYLKDQCKGGDRIILHRKLLDRYRDLCGGKYANLPNDNYIYSYIGYHLYEAKDLDMFQKLFFDLEFLGSKLKVTGPADVLLDFRKYRDQIIGRDDQTAVLDDLTRFINKYGVDLFRYKELDIVQCALQEPRNSRVYQLACEFASANPKNLYFTFRLTGDLISHPQTLPLREEIFSSCFASSKNTILVADVSGTIHLWDLECAHILCKYSGHQQKVTHMELHPKLKQFLSCSEDTTVKLWTLYVKSEDSSGESRTKISPTSPQCLQRNWNSMFLDDPPEDSSIRTFSGHTSPVLQATFSHSGMEIVSCSRDQYIVWSCESGDKQFTASPVGATVATCCSFSGNDSFVFLGGDSTKLLVYAHASGELVASFCTKSNVVAVLTLPYDDNQIVVVTRYNFRIWEWEDPELSRPVPKSVAKRLENCNNVKSYSIGKMNSSDFAESKSSYICAAVSKDGVYIVAATSHAIIQTWNLDSKNLISEYKNYSGIVKCLDIYLEGQDPSVLCCSEDKTVKLWHFDLVPNDRSPKLRPEFHAVWDCDNLDPETPVIAVSDSHNTLKVLQGNSVIAECSEEVSRIALCCPVYGLVIFYGCADGQVKKFDLSQKSSEVIMKLDKEVTYLEAFEQNGQILVAAGDKSTFKIWRKESGVLICYGQTSPVVCCFLIQGQGWPQLLSCSVDASVKLWNTGDGRLTQVVIGGNSKASIAAADMTAARSLLALGDANNSLHIAVLAAAGDPPAVLLPRLDTRRVAHPVTCCRVAPGDRLLLAGLRSGAVLVCGLPRGQELRRLELHSHPVHSIHFPRCPQPQVLAVTVGKLIGWWNLTGLSGADALPVNNAATSPGPRSQVDALAHNHTANIWLCKEGREDRQMLLSCVKLIGSDALKISSSRDFTCFATIDTHGTLHLLQVLK